MLNWSSPLRQTHRDDRNGYIICLHQSLYEGDIKQTKKQGRDDVSRTTLPDHTSYRTGATRICRVSGAHWLPAKAVVCRACERAEPKRPRVGSLVALTDSCRGHGDERERTWPPRQVAHGGRPSQVGWLVARPSWPVFSLLCCFSDPGSGSCPHRLKHLPEHTTVPWGPCLLARWCVGRRRKRERSTCPLPINMRGGGREQDTPIHPRMSASLQRRGLS
jgi:hypothetical protein